MAKLDSMAGNEKRAQERERLQRFNAAGSIRLREPWRRLRKSL